MNSISCTRFFPQVAYLLEAPWSLLLKQVSCKACLTWAKQDSDNVLLHNLVITSIYNAQRNTTSDLIGHSICFSIFYSKKGNGRVLHSNLCKSIRRLTKFKWMQQAFIATLARMHVLAWSALILICSCYTGQIGSSATPGPALIPPMLPVAQGKQNTFRKSYYNRTFYHRSYFQVGSQRKLLYWTW